MTVDVEPVKGSEGGSGRYVQPSWPAILPEVNFSRPQWDERIRTFLFRAGQMRFASFVDQLAKVYGPRTAFVLDRPLHLPGWTGHTIAFKDLPGLASAYAHAFGNLGIRPGDRVGVAAMNRLEVALCSFGVARLGAVPVLLNAMLQAKDIARIAKTTHMALLACDDAVMSRIGNSACLQTLRRVEILGSSENAAGSFWASLAAAPRWVAPLPPRSDLSIAALAVTSGTTGLPKIVPLTDSAVMVGVRNLGRLAALRPRPPSGLWCLVMPLAHAGGYAQLLLHLALGAATLFLSTFDPEGVLVAIERLRPTLFAGTPVMYEMLLRAGAERYDLSSVRMWAGGADVFRDSLVRRFRDLASRRTAFGMQRRAFFLRGYGMAEANCHVALTPPWECGEGCLGWIMPPLQWLIVDEIGQAVRDGRPGELLLRGPSVAMEYLDPEGTPTRSEDGWFHTGDIVRRGRWGLLYFVSRSQDVIKYGGHKIPAAEIDRVVAQHPDVVTAVTVGLPSPVGGERPVAAVVLRSGAPSSASELLRWTKAQLAPHRCPRLVVIVPEIPITFSNKPDRQRLRAEVIAILEHGRSAMAAAVRPGMRRTR